MEVSFKKKSKRSASRKRSRRPLDDASASFTYGGDDVDVDQIQRSIEELREDQKLRDQVLREELASHKVETAAKKQKKAEPAADTTQYGLHDPKKDGSTNQKLLTLLDGQFTGQSGTTDKDQHEELMNKFIEERLQKKRRPGDRENAATGANVATALKTAEDKLFELPDHLNPNVDNGSNSYDDGTDNGMLMGGAGIAEVELPTSYAEHTKKATRWALENTKATTKLDAIGGLASSAVPGNFSTDFNRHKTDYVAEMKSMNKDEQRERGFHQVGKNRASDDRAVSKFRKAESRKLRR
ncbi:hypothetical protein V7S43_016096 [Phytophthora oleae]|uniref:Uncharacterized protein n=1 Tax=Phytophthora oleae TaxID=2107226 RepID=A0ABD3EWY2_9STRA